MKRILYQYTQNSFGGEEENYSFEFSSNSYKNFQHFEDYIVDEPTDYKSSVTYNYVLLCPDEIFKKVRRRR